MEIGTRLEHLTDRVRPSAAADLALWLVVGFFALLFVGAAVIRIDRTARAVGRVIPDARLQTVSNLEGGIVKTILVRTGQAVKAGTPLIQLDETQSNAELGSGQETASALSAKLARLEAEVNGRAPAWPAALPGDADPSAGERLVYAADLAARDALTSAARARLQESLHAVDEADSALHARTAARDAALSELRLIQPLVAKGFEPQLSVVRAQSAASGATADAAAAAAAGARARSSVAEARAALAQAEQDWRVKASADLAAVRGELAARTKQMPALADKLRRTVVRAPMSGRVNRVLVSTLGGTVRAGEPLVEIVPDRDGLTIEAQLSPKDIAAVRLDQPARIALTAYDSAIYGRMDGKVVSISPDSTSNERTGESYYVIRIRTDATTLRDTAGRPLAIGPGMVAEVSLLGEKRSILAYLLTPITRISENAFRE